MKNNLYCVFDAKLATFSRPFTQLNDAAAIREFMDAVADPNPNNQWHKHPEDFSLYRVGGFDDELGKLLPEEPMSLITASATVVKNSAELDVFDKKAVTAKGSPVK